MMIDIFKNHWQIRKTVFCLYAFIGVFEFQIKQVFPMFGQKYHVVDKYYLKRKSTHSRENCEVRCAVLAAGWIVIEWARKRSSSPE